MLDPVHPAIAARPASVAAKPASARDGRRRHIRSGLFQRGPGRQELRVNLVVSTFPGAASLHQIR